MCFKTCVDSVKFEENNFNRSDGCWSPAKKTDSAGITYETYEVDSAAECRYERRDKWFPCMIVKVHTVEKLPAGSEKSSCFDGTYDVEYGNKFSETKVPASFIRPPRGGSQKDGTATDGAKKPGDKVFQNNVKVESRFRGGRLYQDRWFEGEVIGGPVPCKSSGSIRLAEAGANKAGANKHENDDRLMASQEAMTVLDKEMNDALPGLSCYTVRTTKTYVVDDKVGEVTATAASDDDDKKTDESVRAEWLRVLDPAAAARQRAASRNAKLRAAVSAVGAFKEAGVAGAGRAREEAAAQAEKEKEAEAKAKKEAEAKAKKEAEAKAKKEAAARQRAASRNAKLRAAVSAVGAFKEAGVAGAGRAREEAAAQAEKEKEAEAKAKREAEAKLLQKKEEEAKRKIFNRKAWLGRIAKGEVTEKVGEDTMRFMGVEMKTEDGKPLEREGVTPAEVVAEVLNMLTNIKGTPGYTAQDEVESLFKRYTDNAPTELPFWYSYKPPGTKAEETYPKTTGSSLAEDADTPNEAPTRWSSTPLWNYGEPTSPSGDRKKYKYGFAISLEGFVGLDWDPVGQHTRPTLKKSLCAQEKKERLKETANDKRKLPTSLKTNKNAVNRIIPKTDEHMIWADFDLGWDKETKIKPTLLAPKDEVGKRPFNKETEKGLTVISNEEAALENLLIKMARAELGDKKMLEAQFALKNQETVEPRDAWNELLLTPSGCPWVLLTERDKMFGEIQGKPVGAERNRYSDSTALVRTGHRR